MTGSPDDLAKTIALMRISESVTLTGPALANVLAELDRRSVEIERLRGDLEEVMGRRDAAVAFARSDIATAASRVAGRVEELTRERDVLRARVAAVLALHKPGEVDPLIPYDCCTACLDDNGGPVPWPCPTIAALEARRATMSDDGASS